MVAAKQSRTPKVASRRTGQSRRSERAPSPAKPASNTKQQRVLGLLRRPEGSTIAAITKLTGWQPHSVRGFFAGVVRKKLKLALESTKVGDDRVYRIVGEKVAGSGKPKAKQQQRVA